jgi:hypothetical protein
VCDLKDGFWGYHRESESCWATRDVEIWNHILLNQNIIFEHLVRIKSLKKCTEILYAYEIYSGSTMFKRKFYQSWNHFVAWTACQKSMSH